MQILLSVPGFFSFVQQVVRVRSREARRIREPPKRMRPQDKKPAGGPGGPGGGDKK